MLKLRIAEASILFDYLIININLSNIQELYQFFEMLSITLLGDAGRLRQAVGMLNDSRVAAVLGSWISELKRKNPAVITAGLFESLS